MPVIKKSHSALKHGGYAATALLPGESAADFEKLHQDLIAENTPKGVLENDIVATMAGLLWRKRNLPTCRKADFARRRYRQIIKENVPPEPFPSPALDEVDPAVREEANRAAEDLARKELGATFELVEIGEIATVDYIMNDFEVQARLDAMIDKCLKRLLFARGVKSMSATPFSAPPKPLAAA
jgi:hypothetical protein